MTETLPKSTSELRAAIIDSVGAEYLSVFDGLLADRARLNMLEGSVLMKAGMLRRGLWGLSDEKGSSGELHQAITEFWIELEGVAKQRDQLREGARKDQSSTLAELEIKGREEANLLECRLSRIETLLQLPTLI